MDYAQLQSIIAQTDSDYNEKGATDAVKQDAVARRQDAVAAYRNRGQVQNGPSAYESFLMEQAKQAKLSEQNRVIATLKNAFESYGLMGLYSDIEKWARQDYSADAVLLELRKTPAYKDRFPAMEALAQKRRGISEGEYIEFERNATRLEREYGLPEGMLGKDSVTTLLTNEVSGRELENRVVLASNATQTVSQQMRTQFQDFYGVGQGGLAAYFLDPEKAMPLLERQYAASNIAGQGLIQGVNTTRDIAEELFEAGVDQEGARRGFGQVARDAALTQGRNNTITQDALIRGTFGTADYNEQIRRARQAEIGQYAGGGGFVSNNEGASGIGKSQR
jgi:hypothetical protein